MIENTQSGHLVPYQRKALEHIQELAARVRSTAGDEIRAILGRAGLHESIYSKSGGLREDLNARIGLRPGRHLTDRACAPRMTP